MKASSAEKLIVALDLPEPERAISMAEELAPLGVSFKAGLELYSAGGPQIIATLAARHRLFLDLKFHDIPTTVAAAAKAAAASGVWMINVHAAGGREMMLAARRAVENFTRQPLMLAVTVLTSISDSDLVETGAIGSTLERTVLLSRLAMQCGLDGVICSALEIAAVKEATSSQFLTVIPGVRPIGEGQNDQARVATPAEAMRAGGDYLVVGRPITRAADPFRAAAAIIAGMEEY